MHFGNLGCRGQAKKIERLPLQLRFHLVQPVLHEKQSQAQNTTQWYASNALTCIRNHTDGLQGSETLKPG